MNSKVVILVNVRIAYYPEHIDYVENIDALRNNDKITMVVADENNTLDADIFIIQMILGSFPLKIVNRYKDKGARIIVWQSGIWHRTFGQNEYRWVDIADVFMGYDPYIEYTAELMGKRIWRFPPLFRTDLAQIIKTFSNTRANNEYLFSANIFHTRKLGYSPIFADAVLNCKYAIPYNHLWEEEAILEIPFKNVEYRTFQPHDKFLETLDKECSFI